MAGTWFLAAEPTLARAAEANELTDVTRDQNDVLRDQVEQLRADFVNLPQYQAELESLRVGIPTAPDLADYLRQLDSMAQASGLTVTKVEPGAAEVVPAAVPAAVATDPAATGAAAATPSPEATAGTEAAPATAPAATAALEGFYAMPVSMTVVGSFPAALSFLTAAQSSDGRLLLVTSLVGAGQGEAEATGGRPATHEGDIELTISGYLYVLTDPDAVAAGAAPVDPAAPALPQGDPAGSLGSGS
jgi:hypothetical protein